MKILKENTNFGHYISGNELVITKYIIDSEQKGKNIYIHSGIHGGEITYYVIEKLFNYLKENLIEGKIVLVPCANPLSWLQRNYFYTHGKFNLYDGNDWNNYFPGNKEGSLGERMSYAIFEEAKKADLILDLHTSRESFVFSMPSEKKYFSTVKILGLKYNHFCDDKASPKTANTITAQSDIAGVENLTIECGGHDQYNESNVNEIYDGILRVIESFNMIRKGSSKPSIYNDIQVFYNPKKFRAPETGFAIFHKQLGEEFKKGDLIYSIHTPHNFGKHIDIIAEDDGIIWKYSPTKIFWCGDDVLQYIVKKDLERI